MSGLALIEQCDCARKLTQKTCRSCRKNRKQIRNLDSQKKRMEKVLEERKCSQCDDVIDPKKARNTCGGRCYRRQLSLKRKNIEDVPRACRFCNDTIHPGRPKQAITCGSQNCEQQKYKCQGCKLFQVSKKTNFLCRYCNQTTVHQARSERNLLTPAPPLCGFAARTFPSPQVWRVETL